jgi:predicted nucleic acid-binding protein
MRSGMGSPRRCRRRPKLPGYFFVSHPAPLDEQARWQISLWDALMVAAARASGATELISEDLNHGQDYGGVRVINPFR